MAEHKVVSREEWLEVRRQHLKKEKEFNKLRDELSAQRRQLPWVKVDESYLFQSNEGEKSLSALFGDNRQLIVYHFMFGPDWKEGCPSCSFWADNFNGVIVHLNHRDANLVAVAKAPLEKLNAYKERMGWEFEWVSSQGSTFNEDYNVSFSQAELDQGEVFYNFKMSKPFSSEAPGISVFIKDDDGSIYHTYSTYSRGLDMLNGAYHYMDLLPKGRDEGELSYSMAWLRRHDAYED